MCSWRICCRPTGCINLDIDIINTNRSNFPLAIIKRTTNFRSNSRSCFVAKESCPSCKQHPIYGMFMTAGTTTPVLIAVPAIAPCDRAPASATMHSTSFRLLRFTYFTSCSSYVANSFRILMSRRYSVRCSDPPPKSPFFSRSSSNDLLDSKIAGSFALYSISYPSLPALILYEEYGVPRY